jgi:hypothetical protein
VAAHAGRRLDQCTTLGCGGGFDSAVRDVDKEIRQIDAAAADILIFGPAMYRRGPTQSSHPSQL